MGSALRGAARLAAYGILTLTLIPVQMALLALRLPARDRLPRAYHRLCTRLLGLELRVRGAPAEARPVLFVANHSSYLDIMVLGALIDGSFVAKAEVGTWPFFGLLAKLQRTVFVDRRRHSTAQHRDEIQRRLAAGDKLILFPEGTSSDGNRTLPFKSALFSVATLKVEDRPLLVQPVSVTATALDGIPLGWRFRHFYAWYGDMDLASHLWQFIGLGRLTVEVEFHPPVTADQFGSRKALADHCWRAVATGVARAVAGRTAAPPSVPPPATAPLPAPTS